MKAALEILRGELERLFTNASLKELCIDYLGMDPEEQGLYDSTKSVFVRRLIEWAETEKATEALVDSMMLLKKGMTDPRVKQVYESRFPSTELPDGTEIDNFVIEKKVKDGGLGSVYLCRKKDADSEDEARFGLKVIHSEHTLDTYATQRFKTLMRILMADQGPMIQRIEAVGDLPDGRAFVVYPWFHGRSLQEFIPLSVKDALDVFEAIVEALESVHERGFVHADLNPGNVLMRPSEDSEDKKSVALLGFGVDRLFHRAVPEERGLRSYGRFNGLAPEQARGRAAGIRSDIYALGGLLFEMVAGSPPFEGKTAIDLVAAHITQPVPKLSDCADDPISAALDDISAKMLAKEPRQRLQNLDEVRTELEKARRSAEELEARYAQVGTRDDIELYAQEIIEYPDDENALEALKNGAKHYNAWGAATEVLEEAALDAEEESVRRKLLFEAASIAVKHSKNYEKANEIYNQFLEADPDDEEVKAAVRDLLMAEGKYEELIADLAARAESTEDPDVRMGLIGNIAEIYDAKLKDYGNAFDYYLACVTGAEADGELLDKLEKLAERTGRYEELAAQCANAAGEAEGAQDFDTALLYYDRTGRYYYEKIDQPAYALTCFQKVLEYRPADVKALQAMAELYRGAQQWAELAEVMEHLAEVEQMPAARRNHMVEAAQIHYKRLSKTDEAVELLESVVSEDPAHEEAVNSLRKILEETKEWDKLTKLLADNIEALPSGPDQVAARYQLGELYEDRLDNLKAAREQYEKALGIDSRHIDSIKGLERIYARTNDIAGLRDNLETQLENAVTAKQQVVLKERLAGIYEEEFKDYDKAISYLESVLEVEPDHKSSMGALSRLYRSAKRWEDLADNLENRAKDADLEERKDLLRERATVLKENLGDAGRAAQALAEVASLGVDDALESLARTQEEAGDFAAAVETLKKMADAAADMESRVALLTRVAGIQLENMDSADEAVKTLRNTLDMDPSNEAVLSELRRVLVVQGNYAAVMDLLNKELETVEGSRARSEILAQMGVICLDNIKDEERALNYLEQSIKLDDNNLVAGDRLSEIYRKREQWDKALPIYERWADAADALSREKQVELYTYLGDAYYQLDKRDAAAKTLAKAIEAAGDKPDLNRRLGEVSLDLGAFDQAREHLSKYLELLGDSIDLEEKVEVIVKLGKANLGADDVSEAAKLARQATVMSPENLEARMLLADVHEKRGDHRGLVDTCERVLTVLDKDDTRRVGLLRRASRALFDHLKDAEKASGMLKEALEVSPGDRAILSDLLKIYSALKQYTDVIEVVLKLADQVDDSQQLARYYVTVAKIYRDELKRPQKAIEYFEMAVAENPGLTDARDCIVEILKSRNDWDRLVAYYKKAISQLPKDSSVEDKLNVYKPLANLLIEKLDQRDDGILITEAIAKLEPNNSAHREELADLYGWETKYADKSTKLHRQMLEANPARIDSFRMLYRIFSAQEAPDKAWCTTSILSLLNQASPEERTYYREYQLQDLPAVSSKLQAEQWNKVLSHPDVNQTISSIFSVIGKAIAVEKGQTLEKLGIDPNSGLDVAADRSSISGFVNFAAGAMGLAAPKLYFKHGQIDPRIVGANPPGVAIDRTSSVTRDRMGLAFMLGQQLTLLRPGLVVHNLVKSGTELSAWLLASIKSFVPNLPVPGDLAGPVSERLAPLRTLDNDSLERLQGYVQSFISKTTDVNLKRWAKSVDYTMDRAGLLLCGDVAVAVRIIKSQIKDKAVLADRLKALTLFTISDEHFALRKHLGTALESA